MYGFPPIKNINNMNKEQNNNIKKREYNINIREILANKKNQFIKVDEKKNDDEIEVIKTI
jgi:hypothetical protein